MSPELLDDERLLEERKAVFWERTDYDRAFRGTAGAYMTEVEAWALDRVFEERSAGTTPLDSIPLWIVYRHCRAASATAATAIARINRWFYFNGNVRNP